MKNPVFLTAFAGFLFLASPCVVSAQDFQVAPSQQSVARLQEWVKSMNGKTQVPAISVDPAARTWKDLDRESRAWWKRVLLDPAQARLRGRNEPWMADARQFLGAFVVDDSDQRYGTFPDELSDLGRNVVAAGCEDPAVLFASAIVDADNRFDWRSTYTRMEKAAAGWEKDPSTPAVIVLRTVLMQIRAWQMGRKAEATRDLERKALDLLVRMTRDHSFLPAEEELLFEELHNVKLLRENHGPELRRIYEELKGPEWMKQALLGNWEVKEAWAHRGSGWANSVTNQGWEGFSEHLAKARGFLTQAWKLNPRQPYAATRMITVVMGGVAEPGEDERLWFDRAIAAQVDYRYAYESLLWAYRPRWGGSHELMLAFGQECAKTELWDTDVPVVFLRACTDISKEIEDWRRFYRHPEISPMVVKVSEKLVQDPTRVAERKMRLGYLVVNAWMAGDYRRAATAWREHTGPFHPGVVDKMHTHQINEVDMRQDLVLAGSSLAADFQRTGQLYDAGRLAEAEALCRELLPQADPDFMPTLLNRLSLIETERHLATGEWVVLRGTPGLAGWLVKSGDWSGDDQGALINRGTDSKGYIEHRARVGLNFEMRVEFSVEARANCCRQCNVLVGWLNDTGTYLDCWQTTPGELQARIELSGTEEATWPKAVPRQRPVNELTIRVSNGKITYAANGETVAKELPLDPARLSRDGHVGFWSERWCRQNTTRITRIEVRRLTRDL